MGRKLGKVTDRLLKHENRHHLPIFSPYMFIQDKTSETCIINILDPPIINKMQLIVCKNIM